MPSPAAEIIGDPARLGDAERAHGAEHIRADRRRRGGDSGPHARLARARARSDRRRAGNSRAARSSARRARTTPRASASRPSSPTSRRALLASRSKSEAFTAPSSRMCASSASSRAMLAMHALRCLRAQWFAALRADGGARRSRPPARNRPRAPSIRRSRRARAARRASPADRRRAARTAPDRAARDDVDGVDLQHAHARDRGEHIALARAPAHTREQPLRGEMHQTRLMRSEVQLGLHVCSSALIAAVRESRSGDPARSRCARGADTSGPAP